MILFKKICFCITYKFITLLAVVILFISCNDAEKSTIKVANNLTDNTADTVILLTYGEPAPPNYNNAQDIIATKQVIKYLQVAGCEVWQSLLDSVKIENQKAIEKLSQRNPSQTLEKLNMLIENEYHQLQKIDSVLNSNKPWQKLGYNYYTKHNHVYNAYHYACNGTSITINQIISVDSLSLKTIKNNVLPKDSLITNLINLHHETH